MLAKLALSPCFPEGRSEASCAQGGAKVRLVMDGEAQDVSAAMARYAEGDDAAFARVYDALAPRLSGFLRRMLRDSALADDALQQTFLRIHRNRARFVPGEPVAPWAFAIARSVALDLLRHRRRHPESELEEGALAGREAAALSHIAAEELGRALSSELAQVSPKLREAFLLVHLDGLSHAEAARVLGIEETATRVRSHRAVQWLKTRLARFLEDA